MRAKFLLAVVPMLALVLVSGCVNTSVLGGNRPEDVVKGIAQVQEFLAAHPDSDLLANYRSEGYIRGMINEISERCGPYFKIADQWEVVLRDPHTKENLTVWIEKDTNQLSCLYGQGFDSPAVYIPGPPRSKLVITGFSDLDVNDETTDFRNGMLYIAIGNPNLENMVIKRVDASYLDDVMKNTTTSGLLFQGDYYVYALNFSRTIVDDDPFWIDVEVLYDLPDRSVTNQRSRGAVIRGIPTERVIECSSASFIVDRYNFYVGTRIFSVTLRNTGNSNLALRTIFRQDGELREVGEPFILQYGGYKTLDIEGLTKLAESVLFFSEACPGSSQVIFMSDIAGV